MPTEPDAKRAIVYIDGQNLYHAAKEAFGYRYPNYDVRALGEAVCRRCGWQCSAARFYTGVPDISDNAFWSNFWMRKLGAMGRRGVEVFSRALRYRHQTVRLPDGSEHTFLVAQEKGVDIRIALDIVRDARAGVCDVALVFSQDQDLSEVADEVRSISKEHDRWFKMASAYPVSPTSRNRRGINRTDWVRVDRALYDECLDRTDYRTARK